jgi:hypothetical protein
VAVVVLPRLALSAAVAGATVNLPHLAPAILPLVDRAFPRQAATAAVAGFVRAAVVVAVDKLLLVLLRKTAATVARRLRSLILHRIPRAAALRLVRLAVLARTAALRQTAPSVAMAAAVVRPQQPVRRPMAATAALLVAAAVVVGPGQATPLALVARAATALSE